MHDITEVSKAIEKKKHLEQNLPKYAAGMSSLYFRMSSMKLCFHYHMFAEEMREPGVNIQIRELFAQLQEIVARQALENASAEKCQKDFELLLQMREEIIAAMEVLTAYVDCFAIYEHLLNRLEFRFSEEEFDEAYYENNFTNDIMHHIFQDSDNTMTNQRICEMVSQLPMRLTRQKFLELVKDAFSLYVGSDLAAVEDFAYMIRTLAGVYKPEGMDTRFPELKELCDILEQADYVNADKETYERLADTLSVATEAATGLSDLYVGLMELVNDTCVLAMTADSAITEVQELADCRDILREAMGDATQNLDVNDCFIRLEGHQERVYNQISANDFLIDMVLTSMADEAERVGVRKAYEQLQKCARLSSNSLFMKLSGDTVNAKAEREDVDKICEGVLLALQDSFKERPVIINRAVMAIVLGSIPVFFNSVDEIQNYVNTSLSQCRNRAERMACVTLIRMIIDEETDYQ